MVWWEWAIVLMLWGWAMVDLSLLRSALSDRLWAVDQRRIEDSRGLQEQIDAFQRRPLI